MASLLTNVYRAYDLLAVHPRIDPSQIALMGFSLGGRTALWANQKRFQQRYGPSRVTTFAAYLAFYPASCHIKLAEEERVSDAPIRIFHGLSDDAAKIERCREYVARLRDAGKDIEIFEYTGARHWFDNGDLAPLQPAWAGVNFSYCTFVERDEKIIDAATGEAAGVASPCVVSEGSFGYNAEARERATTDVHAFLKGLFRLK